MLLQDDLRTTGKVGARRIAGEEVARLALVGLPLLEHDRRSRLLHGATGREPSRFVEAACHAFRAEGEVERELDRSARAPAMLADGLLSSRRGPSGLENG